MKWWDKFVGGIPKIPLRVVREKPTFSKKKAWLENATSKSLAMIYEAFLQAYGPEQAEVSLKSRQRKRKIHGNRSDLYRTKNTGIGK